MSFTSLFPAPQRASEDRRAARRRRPDQLIYAQFGPHNGGIVIDLSEDGLQFQSVEPIVLGDSLPVTFVLTGSVAAIKATARVVWCNDSGKGGGLKLLDLPKTARREISAWVYREAPAAAPQAAAAARTNGRAPFNLLTTEGRVARPEPVSDEKAMATARLLVSARGYRSDSEAEAVLPLVGEDVRNEIHVEIPNEIHSEVRSEVRDQATSETAELALAETEAQTEIPLIAEAAAEAIPEIAPEAAAPSAELVPAELAEQNAGPNQDVFEASAELPAALPAEAISEAKNPVVSLIDASAAQAAPQPATLPDATDAAGEVVPIEAAEQDAAPAETAISEEIAAEIAPAIADEIVEGVVAGLEAKSELAIEIAPPLVAPVAETAPPSAEEAPVVATSPEIIAPRADSEKPATALLEILLSAAAETVPSAPHFAPAPVLAATAPAAPKATSTEPISIERAAKDPRAPRRVPEANLSRKSAQGDKSREFGKRQKASLTIRNSMHGLSIFANPNSAAVPAPLSSAGTIQPILLTPAPTVVLPGWGAQVLKFVIGVGVGCCLVAGAFVGIVLFGPGHRPLSFADARAGGVAEASAPVIAPGLDVEVIDLNSRRWHLNDSTPDALPFVALGPVVELTPGDSQLAARAFTSAGAGAKLPVAKLPTAKSLVAPSPIAKSAAPKSVVSPAPRIPAAAPKSAPESAAPVALPAQPVAKLESPKNLALSSPLVTRGGNSTDMGAPSITESISSSISYPMSSAVVGDSAPADPRTPVSSNPVFPSVLLLPPARHNADFHVAAPIRQDNPTYPALARRMQVTGTVRIDAFVGKDGRAHSLKVISGDPRLSSATLVAVSNWTFRPAQLDGESVESEVTISVNFDLH